MPRIHELEYSDSEQWLIPCDCCSLHYFRMTWDKDPSFRFAYIEYVRGNPGWGLHGIIHRVKEAWNAFRCEMYTISEIVLNDKAVDTLTEFVDKRWEK